MSNGVSTAAFLSQSQLPLHHRLSMANPATIRTSSVHGGSGNGGFSTASLDRRALRQRQAATIAAAITKANENSNVSHKLTTTFPVGVETCNQRYTIYFLFVDIKPVLNLKYFQSSRSASFNFTT